MLQHCLRLRAYSRIDLETELVIIEGGLGRNECQSLKLDGFALPMHKIDWLASCFIPVIKNLRINAQAEQPLTRQNPINKLVHCSAANFG